MHGACRNNHLHLVRRQLVFRIILHQLFSQNTGKIFDTLNMLAAFQIPALHNRTKCIQNTGIVFPQAACLYLQKAVLLLQGFRLLLHLMFQPVLVHVQVRHVIHSLFNQHVVEGLSDKIGSAVLEALTLNLHRIFPTDYKDGDFIQPAFLFHDLQYCKAIHFGHNQIQQHHRYIFMKFLQPLQRFPAVRRFHHRMLILQYFRQNITVQFHIIYYQYFAVHNCPLQNLMFTCF